MVTETKLTIIHVGKRVNVYTPEELKKMTFKSRLKYILDKNKINLTL